MVQSRAGLYGGSPCRHVGNSRSIRSIKGSRHPAKFSRVVEPCAPEFHRRCLRPPLGRRIWRHSFYQYQETLPQARPALLEADPAVRVTTIVRNLLYQNLSQLSIASKHKRNILLFHKIGSSFLTIPHGIQRLKTCLGMMQIALGRRAGTFSQPPASCNQPKHHHP